METINFPKPKLHLFVCVNDRTGMPGNQTPSCGPRIKPEDVKKVKEWIRVTRKAVWQCSIQKADLSKGFRVLRI